MTAWKQGFVETMTRGPVRIAAGQRWGYFHPGPDGTTSLDPQAESVLALVVLYTSPEGEVALRPADAERAAKLFPHVPFTKYGDKDPCPFKKVDERMAKGSDGTLKEGDLLAHEAWTVWRDMHLHTDAAAPV